MSTDPKFSLIVAKSRNGVIGLDGDLPWRLSGDLKMFKRVTLGKPVIMGRKTWESLPFPLPGRPNLVVSRDSDYVAKKAETFSLIHDAIGRGYELAGSSGADEVMLIGGAQLYAKLMKYCDRMYITEVDIMIEGDAHFPAVNEAQWRLSQHTDWMQGEDDDYRYRFLQYERETS
ncbi:dihydrofolate reductase [Robiginitomaculum antarcticum]|uniref:dihydrofolate reductase n=1 Tax=Robiginitomaculum antarcticum TaxID=437507 RepID=UPI00035E245F|nr:dihydrofolate reductase [Robiginitomaculum antarcticum]